MRKILLTGMSGAGKSAALAELEKRGFAVVAVVLLSAPSEVLLRRIATRATNDYGKSGEDRDLILRHLAEVEPLLRAACTHEVDAAQPLDAVVRQLVAIAEQSG